MKKLIAILVIAGVLATSQARGDELPLPDVARADALYQEGKRLLDERRYEEACPKFEESQKLDPGVGTLLYLASCYELIGRTASAWRTFQDAAELARDTGDSRRDTLAQRRAKKLESRLSRLAVMVPATSRVRGLELRCDGSVIGVGEFGAARPLDPGPHRIEAGAPGRRAWAQDVDVPPGPIVVSVYVPILEPLGMARERPGAGVPTPQLDVDSHRTRRLTGLAVGAAGLILLGTAGYLEWQALSHQAQAEEQYCNAELICTPPGVTLNRQAKSAESFAIGSAVVGAVGVAIGAALYFASPRPRPHGLPRARIAFDFEPGYLGVVLMERF